MSGETTIAFFYYGAGLMFWPVFQLLHRRWTPCAKRLLAVFLVTLGFLAAYALLLLATWRDERWLFLCMVFPLANLVSLTVSAAICIANAKNYGR